MADNSLSATLHKVECICGEPADALCHSFGAAMSGVTGAHQPTHNAVLHCQTCDKPVLECWCFSSEGLIDLPPEVEEQCVLWAKDDRLWTTGETVRFNLRTFARVVIRDTNRRRKPRPLTDDGRRPEGRL